MEDNYDHLPKSMQERAIIAREIFIKSPELSLFDDNNLVWCYCDEDNLWYSLLGNYSKLSPEDKRIYEAQRRAVQEQKEALYINSAEEYYEKILYYSKLRKKVLNRDKNKCQLCGKSKNTKLHVHHILKKKEGGSDCLDNLITCCPSCHKKADLSEYNPEWI